jgi:hypothetical protein
MYHQYNNHKFSVLPTQCINLFCVDLRTKQRLFPYTALTDWFIEVRFIPLKSSGHYIYHQFYIQQF